MPLIERAHSYTFVEILPGHSTRRRDGYQECRLHKTTGRRPKWYCKYAVDVLVGDQKTKRVERREYFGLCSEVGKREAERQADELRKKVNNQRRDGIRESQVPMSGWLSKYKDTFVPTLKPNTQPNYRACCGLIEQRFGAVQMCRIDTATIQGWMNEMATTRTKGTLERILAVLKSVFEVAADYGYTEARNPCERVRVPSGKASPVDLRALTPAEVAKVLAIADATEVRGVPLGNIVRIGVFCGLRVGEILGLEWGDVRPPQLFVRRSRSQRGYETTEPKSNSGRRGVALGSIELRRPASAGDSTRIFDLEYWHVQPALKEIFAKSGITLKGTTCHALRRTYATMRRAVGARSLAEQMGHSAESMSERYVYESIEDQAALTNRMVEMVLGGTTGKKQ